MSVASTESSLYHRRRLSTGLGGAMQDLDLSADKELEAEVGSVLGSGPGVHELPDVAHEGGKFLIGL